MRKQAAQGACADPSGAWGRTKMKRSGESEPVGKLCFGCFGTWTSAFPTLEETALLDSCKASAQFKASFLKTRDAAECGHYGPSRSSCLTKVVGLDSGGVQRYCRCCSQLTLNIGVDTIVDEEGNPLQCVLTPVHPAAPRTVEIFSERQDARLREVWQSEKDQLREDQGLELHDHLRGETLPSRAVRLRRGQKIETIEQLQARANNVDTTADATPVDEAENDEDEIVEAAQKAPVFAKPKKSKGGGKKAAEKAEKATGGSSTGLMAAPSSSKTTRTGVRSASSPPRTQQ
eukprot:6486138-Amphidinium_carterae.6